MHRTLLFLHGWASRPDIWQRQKDYFKDCDVLLPELDADNLRDLAQRVYDLCKDKENITVIAWSMGWLVALKLLEYKLDICCLVSIAGTPKFISEDYVNQGIKKSELRALRAGLKKDFVPCLNNFYQQHRIKARPLYQTVGYFRKRRFKEEFGFDSLPFFIYCGK